MRWLSLLKKIAKYPGNYCNLWLEKKVQVSGEEGKENALILTCYSFYSFIPRQPLSTCHRQKQCPRAALSTWLVLPTDIEGGPFGMEEHSERERGGERERERGASKA